MKKKFLSVFLAPLFVVPIALSSCSSYTRNLSDQQFFVYKSQNYQLEIHPFFEEYVNDGVCTMADISVVFNHPDTATYDQQIYIDSLTINDSYTNPDNGHTYKTNIVSFANDKNKVLRDDGSDAYIDYVIGNFSVSANVFDANFFLNPNNEMDDSSNFKWNSDHTAIVDSVYPRQYMADFYIRNTYMDVGDFNMPDSCKLDGPLTISNKITDFNFFLQYNFTPNTNITLPNSIKTISSEVFEGCTFYQSTFTIPQSVETIGDNAFANLYAPSTSSSSSSTATTTKNVIKVPSKFQSDAERIFGTKPDDSSSSSSSSSTSSNQDDLPNTWTNYDIQFY